MYKILIKYVFVEEVERENKIDGLIKESDCDNYVKSNLIEDLICTLKTKFDRKYFVNKVGDRLFLETHDAYELSDGELNRPVLELIEFCPECDSEIKNGCNCNNISK